MTRIDNQKLGLLLRTVDNINKNSVSGPLANVNWLIRESRLSYVYVYRTLDKLEELSLIKKKTNPDNNAQFLIELTAKGEKTLECIDILLGYKLGTEE